MEPPFANAPLDRALNRELTRGERILWQGRPIPRIQWSMFGIWVFAIPWTAFALFWTAMAYAGTQSATNEEWSWLSLAFPLFGVPFIVVGLGMMAAPLYPLYAARKVIFAVTDQRLIKLTLRKSLTSITIPAERVGLITRKERSDGSGTLRIATHIGVDSDGDRTTHTFDIGEVAAVMDADDAISAMIARSKRRTATA
ncbi:hypothetical protein HKD42_08250 [Altererythrobacter sp. RZ02]|uniref:DUF304 domain-containing protein n=1 Tax=Pontixanthobacter rizhaonensis TaxID=2730337 RepID=A0A848QMF3_9SPHN|nr:hypothetical protein [Pontixanthobacter rizhaonensis]NMW32049.1 hypothetical protein [Pontixanthobacter rizhaonensis]